jgi:hypothetical protein
MRTWRFRVHWRFPSTRDCRWIAPANGPVRRAGIDRTAPVGRGLPVERSCLCVAEVSRAAVSRSIRRRATRWNRESISPIGPQRPLPA